MRRTWSLTIIIVILMRMATTLINASSCSHVEGVAGSLLPPVCGCQSTCTCSVEEVNLQVAGCANPCEYCASFDDDEANTLHCVKLSSSVARSDETYAGGFLIYSTSIWFSYTQGPYAGTTLVLGSDCNFQVNGQACGCQLIDCTTGGLWSLDTVSSGYIVDCSNLGFTGAALNTCQPNLGIASSNTILIGFLVDGSDPCNGQQQAGASAIDQTTVTGEDEEYTTGEIPNVDFNSNGTITTATTASSNSGSSNSSAMIQVLLSIFLSSLILFLGLDG